MNLDLSKIEELEILEKDQAEKFLKQGLFKLGALIIKEVQKNVDNMNLIDTSAFRQGWHHWVDASGLHVESTVEYADYLEYGTYSYFRIHGLNSFPDTPDPKKKDMTAEQKKGYPFGMQGFAPLRRVLRNKRLMQNLTERAFR